jgi:hypothetical protein
MVVLSMFMLYPFRANCLFLSFFVDQGSIKPCDICCPNLALKRGKNVGQADEAAAKTFPAGPPAREPVRAAFARPEENRQFADRKPGFSGIVRNLCGRLHWVVRLRTGG